MCVSDSLCVDAGVQLGGLETDDAAAPEADVEAAVAAEAKRLTADMSTAY